MIDTRGLLTEGIERRPLEVTPFQRTLQCSLVDQFTSRGVDQKGAMLHFLEKVMVDHARGPGKDQRGMQRYKVG